VLLDATALGRDYLAQRFPGITRACLQHGFDWAAEPVPVTPAAHYWMGGIRTDIEGRTSLPGLFAVGEAASTGVHGANRLASNSLLESLVFAWRASDALERDAAPLETEAALADVLHDGSEPLERAELQELMWSLVGLERDAAGLAAAASQLAVWRAEGDTIADGENRNLLDLARVLVHAAQRREESRGAHERLDFPQTDPALAHSFELVVPVTVAVSA
jgi:L-aspartate oxidase